VFEFLYPGVCRNDDSDIRVFLKMPYTNRVQVTGGGQIALNLQEARLMEAADEMLRAVAIAAVTWQAGRRGLRSKLDRIGARRGTVRRARSRAHRRARSSRPGYFRPDSAEVS
jgi:hypothetical protein